MDLEYVKCNYCDSENAKILVSGRDYSLSEMDDTCFEFNMCSTCGLIYQNPRPSSSIIGNYYPESYSPYNRQGYLGRVTNSFFGYEKNCIMGYIQTGKLLDVGCASGYFLNEMKKGGTFEVSGVELSPLASQKARDEFGLDVITGDLLAVNFPAEQYDIVTMWNVLEHVYDPLGTIKEAWRILKPGGYFIIRVPNPSSFAAKLFGKFWAGLDLPRHLYLFPRNVLIHMAEDTGFSIIKTSFWGYMWPTSIKFWFNGREKSKNNVKSLAASIIYHLSRVFIVRLLFFPFWEIINRIGLGENVTLVFKK